LAVIPQNPARYNPEVLAQSTHPNEIMSNQAVQPRVSLVGNSSINEGSSSSYRLQLDQAATTDMTFTIRINDGSAESYDGDGSKQKYKGDLKKSVFPELNRDFTGYDSQGRIISGDTMTLTIKAGQTISDSYNVQTWKEEVSMGGKKAIDSSTALGEGNESFTLEIAHAEGCVIDRGHMPITIVDNAPYKWHSPLAIDLNGDGIKTLSIDKGIEFDLFSTGTKNSVGWISRKDGLLAIDNDGNGQIDNGNELFGGGVGDGFAKLDSFDTNRDGLVDANDQGFESLKIWRDGNSNGVTDRSELQALAVFGISSLNVEHIAYDQAAQLDKRGNILGERGSVNTIDGKSLDMIDVYFQVNDASIG
jgi:serine-aspartate repeat-containing protein C/D/E